MFFLLIGILGVALKYFEIAPVAALSWWLVLAPFGATVLWWWWSDSSGYTAKKVMQKMEKRKKDRIDKQRDAMGLVKKRK